LRAPPQSFRLDLGNRAESARPADLGDSSLTLTPLNVAPLRRE
jgi:hypothetical protein